MRRTPRHGGFAPRHVLALWTVAVVSLVVSFGALVLPAHAAEGSAYRYDSAPTSTTATPNVAAGAGTARTPSNGTSGSIVLAVRLVVAAEGLPPIAGGSQLQHLLNSGNELDPADAGGQLTRAGRAYAKAGEVFGPTSGGPAAINQAGQQALEDILANPGTTESVC